MNPYRILAQVAGTLALVVAAFFFGRSTGIDHQKSADLAVMQKAIRAGNKAQDAIGKLSASAANAENVRQEKVREIYRDVPVIVARPVYSNVCADADGVGLLDRARDAANGGESGRGAAGDSLAAPDVPPKG